MCGQWSFIHDFPYIYIAEVTFNVCVLLYRSKIFQNPDLRNVGCCLSSQVLCRCLIIVLYFTDPWDRIKIKQEMWNIHAESSTITMNDSKKNDNVPPNSRLFIVCGKSVEEEDFREAFGTFGQVWEFIPDKCCWMLLYIVIFKVESVQIHKDRKGESKGIAYVKFSKTSEAALAVEEMNGRCIGNHPRPLKVEQQL